MGLKPKFFAIILIVNGLLAGGLYLFISWNFEQSFSNYLNKRELRVLESFAGQLEIFYEENESWEYFENNPTQWNRFSFQTLARDLRRRERHPSEVKESTASSSEIHQSASHQPESNQPESHQIDDRVNRRTLSFKKNRRFKEIPEIPIVLLNSNKKIIAGAFRDKNNEPEDNIERSLKVDGKIVGYLSIPTRPSVRDYLDNQFIEDQSKNLVFVLVFVLLFAVIASVTLSLFLIKRITALVDHVKLLSLGNYDTEININGRDELNVLSHHLSDLGSTLKENTKQRKQWVADISHELRTPVAILQADLEAIEDGVREMDQSSIIRLQNHVARLKNLINDLYELSLSDSGALTYNKKIISLNELIEESVNLLKDKFEEKSIKYMLDKTNSLNNIFVLGDSERLMQLFLNILENAIKYTDSTALSPGEIKIDYSVNTTSLIKQAVITIQDSSPGVPLEILPKLTDRLFRLDSSRNRDRGGAGLGLALCKNIIEAHQGTLEFEPSQLGGLKVKVLIPIANTPNL